MNLDELRRRKKELGYTNDDLAEISGVPLGTVQRIMSGETKNPRRDTWEALERALSVRYFGDGKPAPSGMVKEEAFEYSVKNEKKQGEYTVDDYYALPDDMKAELIDGVIYDMSPSPTTFHQYMISEIVARISSCIAAKEEDCMVMVDIDVQLDKDEKTMIRPDIAVVCDTQKVREQCVYGAPEIVIEVLSPSTRKRDMTLKLKKYLEAGVKVYWMVDVKKKQIVTYQFDEEDFIPRIYSFDEIIPLKADKGECEIDLKKTSEVLNKVYGI